MRSAEEKKAHSAKKHSMKKIRSMKNQITVIFIGLLLLSILTITAINGLFWRGIMFPKRQRFFWKPGIF